MLLVDACLRRGAGGSPTAVLAGEGLSDADLMRIPGTAGVSHVAVLGPAGTARSVRFFTPRAELPSCGHGTVAAVAALALAGRDGFDGVVRIGGRDVRATGRVSAAGTVESWFDQGTVVLRDAPAAEEDDVLRALGLSRDELATGHGISVASPGRERMLVPVADPGRLSRLQPDLSELGVVCGQHGQLGCFVYVPPSPGETDCAARMFAPAIGVPEDVANANSTGCLAAHLVSSGRLASGERLAVHQGDALGRPSTVWATSDGAATRVGGLARIR